MSEQTPYKFNIDNNREILLNLPDGVFVPTGTTTNLINAVKGYLKEPGKVLDLGAGSGVVGIALYLNSLVKSPLYASDLSERSIECIQKNAEIHQIPVVTKTGSLFEPWNGNTFDYIVDDISGVAEEVAALSQWFDNVPCQSGVDGADLVIRVLQEAPEYLNPGGVLFFPVLSLSNSERILNTAHQHFGQVKLLRHEEWPLPKEMYQHMETFNRLRAEGYIQYEEKFGMMLWSTDIYAASNS